jgi:hypothetical protein
MPIEIRELVIRATIGPASGGDSRHDETSRPAQDGGQAPLDVEAIVQECVRQVLRVLARDQER